MTTRNNDNRNQNQQRQTRQMEAVPGKNPASDPRYTFTNEQLNIIGLLVLASWLDDEKMRKLYHDRLVRMTNNDSSILRSLFEKLIESVERGFMLASPPFLLSPYLLSKFLNGRRTYVNGRPIVSEDYERLNQVYVTRYFNLEEAPGESIQRMLVDEGLLPANAIVKPVDLSLVLHDNPMTAKDILAVDSITQNDYNTCVVGAVNAFAMNSKYAANLDRLTFQRYFVMDANGVTEWCMEDTGIMVRVIESVKRKYGNQGTVVRYDIVDFSTGV